MKFNVVIGNPPYSSEATESNNSRLPGDNLAKKFAMKSLMLCTEYMAMIMPYSGRNYTSGIAEQYRQQGLHEITKTSFQGIEQTVGVYYFNRHQIVDRVSNEFDINLPIPVNNITKFYYKDPSAIPRNQYEQELSDNGKYKIHVTVNIIKYTDDVKLINKLNDKTLGNWRVIINKNANRNNIGPIAIVDPSVHLARNVWPFVVDNEGQAIILKNYLTQPHVNAILTKVKCSICNSSKFLQYIESPF